MNPQPEELVVLLAGEMTLTPKGINLFLALIHALGERRLPAAGDHWKIMSAELRWRGIADDLAYALEVVLDQDLHGWDGPEQRALDQAAAALDARLALISELDGVS